MIWRIIQLLLALIILIIQYLELLLGTEAGVTQTGVYLPRLLIK